MYLFNKVLKMYKELYQIEDIDQRKKIIKKIQENKDFRKEYFSEAFYSFCKYYFPTTFKVALAEFQKEWLESLRSWKKVMIVWFRWSAKRTLTLMYLVWVIVYRKRRHIILFSYTEKNARDRLVSLVSQLKTNKNLIEDFGRMFPTWKRLEDDDVTQKSISEFITLNKIKIKWLGIGWTLRWSNYISQDWVFRPDMLVLDDIDVTDSVRNKDVIDASYSKLKDEIFWSMLSTAKIIFLWNVISNDWLVPRIEAEVRDNPDWILSKVPIIENWKIKWDYYVMTDEERDVFQEMWIEKLSLESIKRQEGEWFMPNYMLVPNVRSWNPVFNQENILIYSEKQYKVDTRYKDLWIYQEPDRNKFYFWWIDTAKWWANWDFSTIVIRDEELKLVAVYQSRISPDSLALVIDYIIELWYSESLIGIESNNTWISTLDKAKEFYWRDSLYREKEIDTITMKTKRKYWFNTNWKSKTLIISNLEEALRKKHFDVLDKREKDDLVNYYYDNSGGTNALSGKFDDLVIAEAICYHMSKQNRTSWF